MNERIRELAEQAGFEYEKFAELIVWQCAEICVKNEYYNEYSAASEWAQKGAQAFKKYFGVTHDRTN
jgi:hypothetical protein